MTHTEFILTVKKEIKEISGTIETTGYSIGNTITVDEATFNRLQKNEDITRYTNSGTITFNKYDFDNEVAYTQVTVEYGTRKLGQRNTKI